MARNKPARKGLLQVPEVTVVEVPPKAQARIAELIRLQGELQARLQALADGLIIASGGDPDRAWNYNAALGRLELKTDASTDPGPMDV